MKLYQISDSTWVEDTLPYEVNEDKGIVYLLEYHQEIDEEGNYGDEGWVSSGISYPILDTRIV